MTTTPTFEVELPAGGGKLHLMSADEVKMWDDAAASYRADYGLSKTNDLVLLGALLTQQLALFRAQQRVNGMVPVLDANDVPTGQYKVEPLKASELAAATETARKAGKEIREIEQVLGIDKKTREAGGNQTIPGYVSTLKRAANDYGVHISKRTLAYEKFCMALRTKLRILRNADDEDKSYENISPELVLDWAYQELATLEEVDKKFAKEKGKLVVGKL
jgi:ABC-type molybdate transport system substrate-binding protein